LGRWSHFFGIKNDGNFVGVRERFLRKKVPELANFFYGPATLPYFEDVRIVRVKRILEFLTNYFYLFLNGGGG